MDIPLLDWVFDVEGDACIFISNNTFTFFLGSRSKIRVL